MPGGQVTQQMVDGLRVFSLLSHPGSLLFPSLRIAIHYSMKTHKRTHAGGWSDAGAESATGAGSGTASLPIVFLFLDEGNASSPTPTTRVAMPDPNQIAPWF